MNIQSTRQADKRKSRFSLLPFLAGIGLVLAGRASAQTPVTITTQPECQNVCLGTPVTLSVTASGTAPMTYQWQFNGTNLPAGFLPGNLITIFAGDGQTGCAGNGGVATNASLYYPSGIAFDITGNLYIADTYNNRVRKVDTNGIITIVAGNGNGAGNMNKGYFTGDGGPATNASLYSPMGVAVDNAGNLYIADSYNNRIRKVDTNGIITTVAGGNSAGAPGLAIDANLHTPTGVAVDPSGNLYIADFQNNRICKVDTNGILFTVAGNGNQGYSGDGGAATNASLYWPESVTVDTLGNLYIADKFNQRVREVGTNGIITTVAGNGVGQGTGNGSYSGDGGAATNAGLNGPEDIAVDAAGNFYISDGNNNRIRKVDTNGNISTVAGGGNGGAGGAATNAILNGPSGIVLDIAGGLYFADTGNNVIQKTCANTLALGNITYAVAGSYTVVVSDPAGSVTSSVTVVTVTQPPVIETQPTNIIVGVSNNAIMSVVATGTEPLGYQWQFNGTNLPDGVLAVDQITTVAGNNTLANDFGGEVSTGIYSGDGGTATNAGLFWPKGVTVDTLGNVYIADSNNNRIRRVDTGGIITTVAGNGNGDYYGDGGPATNAALDMPVGVAVDIAGNLYIADSDNNCIRKVDTNGIITTVAGDGDDYGDGGPATNATLNMPIGVAVDTAGNVYIADSNNNCIRKVDTNGIITTVAGNGNGDYYGDGGPATNAALSAPDGVAVDSAGNLYIADAVNNRIRKVDTGGIITTVAGNGAFDFYGDGGPATNAALNWPVGVAVDSAGNLYIGLQNENCISKVDTNGIITIFAGRQGLPGFFGDGGAATNANFFDSSGIAAGAAGLYIADTKNNCIRQVDTNGIINNVAGGEHIIPGDGGAATNAGLNGPDGIAVDAAGNLYIDDAMNQIIRKVNTNGIITTVAGNADVIVNKYSVYVGTYSGDGGAATNAGLNEPDGIAVDAAGNLYIADANNNRIRKVDTNGIITTVAGNADVIVDEDLGYTGTYSGDGGAATNAGLNEPTDIVLDSAGNLYIADFYNSRIRKVDTNGIITTVAGNGAFDFSGDGGPATNAVLNMPVGVAVDSVGNLYIADTSNNRIRKMDTNGIITTVAGNGNGDYSGDGGPATNAALNMPDGVAVDSAGNLYIADSNNNRIRKVDTGGIITTVAGNGASDYYGDGGSAANAALSLPVDVAMDSAGNLYIVDNQNGAIRKVSVTTMALDNVTTANAGSYSIIISINNDCCSVTGNVATVTVTNAP